MSIILNFSMQKNLKDRKINVYLIISRSIKPEKIAITNSCGENHAIK